MTSNTISTTIEILGKIYPIRCEESELPSLQQAAALLDQKMAEIKETGKVINLERIAIISALNMAHQYLQLDQQKTSYLQTINQRITQLQEMLDASLNKVPETELIYSAE